MSGQCLKEMKGHTEDVSCLLAIGDGKIISGSADKTVRFWNTAVGDGTSVAGFAAVRNLCLYKFMMRTFLILESMF